MVISHKHRSRLISKICKGYRKQEEKRNDLLLQQQTKARRDSSLDMRKFRSDNDIFLLRYLIKKCTKHSLNVRFVLKILALDINRKSTMEIELQRLNIQEQC